MRRQTQISRADLLKCLGKYGEAHVEGLAAALGYFRPEDKPKPPPRRPPVPPSSKVDEGAAVTVPKVKPKARFYRVVAQRPLEPEEVTREEPRWLTQGKPFQAVEELSAPVGLSPPSPPPLMPWSRLWPFLKTVLSHQQTLRALDVPRIVERLARVQTLRHLPRKRRQGWADQCQIIVDYALPLLPFWRDFNQLCQRLRGLRGKQGLQLIAFPESVPGDDCWVWVGDTWREYEGYSLPRAGKAVLVLSDLGCIDGSDLRRCYWYRLGVRLQRAGCRPLALMPCPPRWWDRELTELFYPVCWDRGEHPPRRIGARPLTPAPSNRPEQDPGAEQLLALLAPAIRVEPALLRAVRYLLPARDLDVGSEAAAWNHPKVHPTALAFYYDREAIAEYREQFRSQDEELRPELTKLIEKHHAALSPAIAVEEGLVMNNTKQYPGYRCPTVYGAHC